MLLAPWAGAQTLTTVNEALSTTNGALFVSTSPPQILLNNTTYTGLVPNVSMAASSNVVVGNCVIYSSGVIDCLGVRLSTTDPAGTYVPYSGATADVNIGTHKMLAAQFGAGTSPSTNFLFDGLGTAGAYVRISAAVNDATGYYWGGTRGYSMQERYDLSGTPFTLHDELNNVDRFYLDTSGEFYFPVGITFSSGTSLGAIKAASANLASLSGLGLSTGAVTDITMGGNGNGASPLGVNFSTITTALAGKAAAFTGISSACAAGYYLSTMTVTNGIVTGGGCMLAGTGSGGGIVFATATLSTDGTGFAPVAKLNLDATVFKYSTNTFGQAFLTALPGPTGATGPQGPGGAGVIGFVQDKFLGLANGVTKVFTLTYTPSNGSEHVKLDGHILSGTSDYTLVTNVVTMTTAPATACTGAAPSNCTSEFEVDYATGATGVNAFILNSSQTVSGSNTDTGQWTFAAGSTVTISTQDVSIIAGTITVSNLPIVNGLDYVIASTITPVGGSGQIIFGGLNSSSGTYSIDGHVNLVGVAQNFYLRFGGDVGGNYQYVVQEIETSGSSGVQNGTSVGFCQLNFLGATVPSGEYFNFHINDIRLIDSRADADWIASYDISAGGTDHYSVRGFCKYKGSSNIKIISISTSANGLFNGSIVLKQKAGSGN